MNGHTFAFALLVLALLALLVYLAAAGSVAALLVLAILLTVALVAVGAGIALVTQHQANQKQQQDFVNNAKENMALMAGIQTIQNRQNHTLMEQLRTTARLPEQANGNGLLIDAGIFDELDE